MTGRAIVLVPGFSREERFLRRDILVRNLLTVEGSSLQLGSPVEIDGERGQGLRRRALPPDSADDMVVFEAHWADMANATEDTGPWRKLWQGFELVQYWVLSRAMWGALGEARFATLGLMASGLLLVLWYLSMALLVASALASDPALTEQALQLPIVGSLLAGSLEAARIIGSWKFWALVAFVLGLVDVDALVAKAAFVKAYFENSADETEVGLRDRVRLRVQVTVSTILDHGYEEVLIVGHGFGAAIAVDVLSGMRRREDWQRLTLVTLGAPLGILRRRSKWLAGELDRLMRSQTLRRWVDFHSEQDWLSLPVPGHDEHFEMGASRRVEFEAPLGDRLTTRTHGAYFRYQPILELLAGPMPVDPVAEALNDATDVATLS